jgi:urocanate hydratase
MMLSWDVNNGVARRAWSGNENAEFNIKRQMEFNPKLRVTIPNWINEDSLEKLFQK